MSYEPLTIIFSNSKTYTPVALWFFKLLDHTATHVSFGLQKDGQQYVFHMSGAKGAILTPREKFIAKNNIVKEYLFVDDLSDQIQKHLKYLGTKYSHTSATIHILSLIFVPLRYFLIFRRVRNEFFCSNFVRQLDPGQKVKAWRKISRYWATVDELMEACENNLEFIEVI
jgi:hypothetical protein